MKKQLLALALLLVGFAGQAQLSTGELPPSFSQKDLLQGEIKTIKLETPDLSSVMAEDESEEMMFKPRRFGVILPCKVDFFSQAEKTSTEEGIIYRLAVEVPEAQALIFYSERFVLPEKGKFFVYNADHSKVLGAFSAFNNHELQTFATEYVEGEKMILEYFEPKGCTEQALIDITEIGYAYRDIPEKLSDEYRSSGSCNVNVNCSEGENFRKQQRAVVRIQLKLSSYYIGWCTGTLLNNTNYDYSPYLLTAAHCISDVESTSYYSQFVFYFKYETSGCTNSSSEPSRSKSLTGASRKAFDNSYGNTGSDFCLMLLNDEIPQSYDPFWCGWDRRNTAVTQGVCIHHPSGDVKKISTFNSRLQSVTFDTDPTHWQVQWVETDNGFGVTEGGSSGSALFNSYGQVIGDLTGGSSACDVADAYKLDYYGKFYWSWDQNGSANSRKLKPWLDPANTGAQSIWGMDYNSSLTEVANYENIASIAPNPAKNRLTITFDATHEDISYVIYDQMGREMQRQTLPSATLSHEVELSGLQSGVYIVRIKADGTESSHKIIVQQ